MTSTTLDPVAATATRNFIHQDPLIDWLDLYGEANGFVRDDRRPGFDVDTDLGRFLREKGREFEAGVMRLIAERFEVVTIVDRSKPRETSANGEANPEWRPSHDPEMIQRTIEAMQGGAEIIHQGVLWDRERQTYGLPDLIVRSDVLSGLVEIPPLDAGAEYAVVDVKFSNIDLNAKDLIGNGEGEKRRKAQLMVYNRALAEILGQLPKYAYILGRSWAKDSKKDPGRGDGCFDRLGAADMLDPELDRLVDEACDWVRRVRSQGVAWNVSPRPSVPELYPNMSNTQDSPWHMAKKEIAESLKDVTMLWQVTPKHRPLAHAAGVFAYDDPLCKASLFGLSASREATLERILALNQSEDCPDVTPETISAGADDWRDARPLEFYVDFETVSDLNDDFTKLPKKGGQPLIFMIGCGHVEGGKWQFKAFTCDRLVERDEARIIDEWLAHMDSVRARLWPEGEPLVFHWSHAEVSFLDRSYNSARERHQRDWPSLNWYDFLVKVMREEPVAVKGALAFGLKSVAKAMHRNGLIETVWDNGPGDGLGAMVGAWRCDEKAAAAGGSMKDFPLMRSIEEYNEVDCKVMWEIVRYLRAHH